VTLISAWVSQVAKSEQIDTAMLATRADLVAFLVGDPEARLAHGWRNELLGEGIGRLLRGEAGLTFERGGGLHLVAIER
jgi:ribonuclease D